MMDDKENMTDNMSYKMNKYLQTELDKIELPRETIYMIDKVVRQRVKKGPFGMENSELMADQHDKEVFEKNDRIQRLVDGMSSHSRINNTAEDPVKEADISSEGAVRRINSVCARAASTMVPSSVKGIQMSNEKKFKDDLHASIQSVRSITFEQWCRQKEMMQRLKDQLIEDAKMEILESRKLNDTKEIQNWEMFSKLFFILPNRAMVKG